MTWTLTTNIGGFLALAFIGGKWIATGGDNTGRSVVVMPPTADAATLVTNFLPSGLGYFAPMDLCVSSQGLLTLASTVGSGAARPVISTGTDPAAQYAVAPNVPSTGLVLPKRYYMRAR